jgi:hypothetical protein
MVPVTEAALREGTLTFSAVRELTRVVTLETEQASVDAARGKRRAHLVYAAKACSGTASGGSWFVGDPAVRTHVESSTRPRWSTVPTSPSAEAMTQLAAAPGARWHRAWRLQGVPSPHARALFLGIARRCKRMLAPSTDGICAAVFLRFPVRHLV